MSPNVVSSEKVPKILKLFNIDLSLLVQKKSLRFLSYLLNLYLPFKTLNGKTIFFNFKSFYFSNLVDQ